MRKNRFPVSLVTKKTCFYVRPWGQRTQVTRERGVLSQMCPLGREAYKGFSKPNASGYFGMAVILFGYRALIRASTARLKECSGCVMQYWASDNNMPSMSVVPRISTVSLVSLFT